VRTGTFVGYTLDNLIGVQPMEHPRRDLPDLAAGEFATLVGWLREHGHRHGRKLTPNERATGGPISAAAWAAHVRYKFAGLYGL
jgi:carboxypeptidase Taq